MGSSGFRLRRGAGFSTRTRFSIQGRFLLQGCWGGKVWSVRYWGFQSLFLIQSTSVFGNRLAHVKALGQIAAPIVQFLQGQLVLHTFGHHGKPQALAVFMPVSDAR